jgi:O-antigen/teichoic acid export membrane protein
VTGYLTRLARALAAYQIADLVAKVMAVLLLPVYTRYIDPTGYGEVELLASSVILASIVVRLGMIESFLRFYFSDDDRERREALERRAVGFLLVTTTILAGALASVAGPLSKLVLGHRDPGIFLIAVLGLWTFTNLELAYALLRVRERIRTYAIASLANVAMTIAGSVVLVVGFNDGARGLLAANYGASTIVLVALWISMSTELRPRSVPRVESFNVLLRFGLPTVPAEASVYLLSVVDRYFLRVSRDAAAVGLYSIAVKLAGTVAFIVRGFQYAWPPLAYSIRDDADAARVYGLVTTYYLLVSGWVVAALALLGRWVLRILAAPQFFPAHTALTWVSLGWALYGLWVVFLVIAGRAKVTTRNFPAALVGLAVNVALLFALVPSLGITGAGLALCGAYLAMLVAMHLLTRRAFAVDFEWGRIIHLTVVFGALAVGGELLAPTHGAIGLLIRLALVAAMPVVLVLTGFFHDQELAGLRSAVATIRRQGRAPGPVRPSEPGTT